MADLMASVSAARSTNMAWSAADAVSGRRDRPARPDRRGDIRSKDTDRSYTSNSSICQHCQHPGGSGEAELSPLRRTPKEGSLPSSRFGTPSTRLSGFFPRVMKAFSHPS